MTPVEIAEVRPRLLDFTAEMLGGLPRKDQRAAGELYVRGLLTDGQRKSMQPMAARLGVDHQRLQQFITSSTWDYAAVRRNVARWFAASFPVEALVIDDTGFPKDGDASPCVARQYSGTLGKTANCQIGVSVHLVNEGASCAADWRLFCPESWDDQALADPVAAAGARRRRKRAGIPGDVRHREKWRLALDMIEEMTGPGGWGVLDLATAAGGGRPAVAADIGYGDNALFREQLTAAGWQYAIAVKGSTTAHDGGAVPQARPYGGLGQPPKARVPAPAGDPAPARPRPRRPGPPGDLAARHQGHPGQPRRRHDQLLPGHPGPARQPAHPPGGRPQPARLLAAGRMAARGR
jgi:SRSO17 transposase